jgi:excisionase family DNA binding protein
MSNSSNPIWLTLSEAAHRARTSAPTLRREVRARRLRCARVGGRRAMRFRPAWIDEWLEQTSTPAQEDAESAASRPSRNVSSF